MPEFPSIVHRLAASDRSSSQDDLETSSNFSSGSNDLWEPQRVLTLDGNGTQGLFSLYVLEALMEEVAQVEMQVSPAAYSSASSPLFRPWRMEAVVLDQSGEVMKESWQPPQSYHPCHYFDYITGSSTGGLIASLLGAKRLTVREAIERAENIFTGLVSQNRRRNSKVLMRNLEVALDEDVVVPRRAPSLRSTLFSSRRYIERHSRRHILQGDEHACQTMVFATLKASSGNEAYIFRSYRGASSFVLNAETHTWNVSIIDACRAALADPEYFNSVEVAEFGTFRDADVLEIDPALETYNELEQNHGRLPGNFQCLLSIGTGTSCFKSQRTGKPSVRYNEYTTRKYLDRKSSEGKFKYDRICRLDEPRQPLKDLCSPMEVRRDAEACIRNMRPRLRRCAAELVLYRRNRAQTVRWESYVSIRIACPFCTKNMERSQLIAHLGSTHAEQMAMSQSRTV